MDTRYDVGLEPLPSVLLHMIMIIINNSASENLQIQLASNKIVSHSYNMMLLAVVKCELLLICVMLFLIFLSCNFVTVNMLGNALAALIKPEDRLTHCNQ